MKHLIILTRNKTCIPCDDAMYIHDLIYKDSQDEYTTTMGEGVGSIRELKQFLSGDTTIVAIVKGDNNGDSLSVIEPTGLKKFKQFLKNRSFEASYDAVVEFCKGGE